MGRRIWSVIYRIIPKESESALDFFAELLYNLTWEFIIKNQKYAVS
jgi:hypothetical protein